MKTPGSGEGDGRLEGLGTSSAYSPSPKRVKRVTVSVSPSSLLLTYVTDYRGRVLKIARGLDRIERRAIDGRWKSLGFPLHFGPAETPQFDIA